MTRNHLRIHASSVWIKRWLLHHRTPHRANGIFPTAVPVQRRQKHMPLPFTRMLSLDMSVMVMIGELPTLHRTNTVLAC
jgi:hypothetical protein